MRRRRRRVRRVWRMAVASIVFLGGCAAVKQQVPVADGSRAAVHYTCRLRNGEIAATNDRVVAVDESLPKSAVFQGGKESHGPVEVKAGPPERCPTCPADKNADINKDFETHIRERLGEAIVGFTPGETRTVELTAELTPGLKHDDRFLTLARTWRYAKKETVARDGYETAVGKAPRVGDELPWNPPFSGRVAAVDDARVTLDILAPQGETMSTSWGDGEIRDRGDHYEVAIDARVGRLVRTGPLVGKIVEIDEEHDVFITDYGHPFGGEPLLCEVTVEPREETGKAPKAAGKTPDDPAAFAAAAPAPPSQGAAPAPQGGDTAARGDAPESSGKADKGDLVQVRYQASLPDGTAIRIGAAGAVEFAAGGPEAPAPQVEELVAGEEASFPGVANVVLGMETGERRSIALPPGKAFGPINMKDMQRLPRQKRIPRIAYMAAEEYMKQFKTFPVAGKEVPLTPYFKARIIESTETHVKLQCLVEEETAVEQEIGSTAIRFEGDEIVIDLAPRVGAPFELAGRRGRISEADGTTFTVDFNHPLAGQSVLLDVELLSLTKASRFAGLEIPWTQDHDLGLVTAENESKPVVVVLYASWCGWSKRLLNQSLADPRIKLLRDRFVWVKVDSDVEKQYRDRYHQEGFPMIVLLGADGKVLKTIDGFRPAAALSQELKGVLESTQPERPAPQTAARASSEAASGLLSPQNPGKGTE